MFESVNGYDRFIWDKNALDFAENQHIFYGGKSIRSREGLLLYTINNGTCSVKSDNFTAFDIADIISSVDANRYEIEGPCSLECENVDFQINKNGMALAVSDAANRIIDSIVDAYLYFTLD